VERWPRDGVPQPTGVAGLGGALQGDRRRAAARAFDASLGKVAEELDHATPESRSTKQASTTIACGWFSPAVTRRLPPDAQIALTLRESAGLTTEAIASAFLTSRRRWRSASCAPKQNPRRGHPFEVPTLADLPARLDAVLHVVTGVQRGVSRVSGATLTREDLSGEAIRLGGCSSSCCPSRGGRPAR